MSFKGDIASLALSDVIQNLSVNQKTGTLTVSNCQVRRHIQFRDGKIVCYADDQGFSILDWLFEKGIVPAESQVEVRRRYGRAKRKTLGEILRDLDLLDLDSYRSYLKSLLTETLYEVLSFKEGSFVFQEGDLDESLGDRDIRALDLDLNPMSILMEAARRTDDWQKIRRSIPSENEIYVPATSDLAHLLEQTPDEVQREALELMDGTRALRQVIARLPYMRFDACGAVAQLIAEKKVRPLDSDLLLQNTSEDEDPVQTVTRLKIILEREPNNREILQRLAELTDKVGNRDESATYNKLLAISYMEEENLEAAERCLRKSLGLNARDHTTWVKLWDAVRRQGRRDKMLLVGAQFVEHFTRLGLLEIARDHLNELIELFPDHLKFRCEHADVVFKLGDHVVAVKRLTDLAADLLRKNRLDDAEKVFAQILKYDSKNSWAKKSYEEIHSGKLAARRIRRRRLVHNLILFSLFFTLCAHLAYELHVHGQFFQVTKSVFAEGLIERGEYEEAIERIEAVQRANPFSLTSLHKAPPLMKVLREKQTQQSHQRRSPGAPPEAEGAESWRDKDWKP